jgi:hypothetical protein
MDVSIHPYVAGTPETLDDDDNRDVMGESLCPMESFNQRTVPRAESPPASATKKDQLITGDCLASQTKEADYWIDSCM